jgi:hypothetical protein
VGGIDCAVTINDAKDYPLIVIDPASGKEGTAIQHTVTVYGSYTVDLKDVAISLVGKTATIGTDTGTVTVNYDDSDIAVTLTDGVGTITIPAGTASFAVKVATVDDGIYKGNKTYEINVGPSSALGTILDANSAPVASVGSASGTEGHNLVHSVKMSCAAALDRTYSLCFEGDSTLGEAASIGTDTCDITNLSFTNGVTFSGSTSIDGTITVPAGVSGFNVIVITTSDHVKENTKYYSLSIGTGIGIGTIYDLKGYTSDNPFPITSSNAPDYLTMDTGSSHAAYYYGITSNVAFDGDVVVGDTDVGNQLTITGGNVVVSTTGNLTLGNGSGSSGKINLHDGILSVGGSLAVGNQGTGIIAVGNNSLLMVDGTVSSRADSYVYLYGYDGGGRNGGCFAVRGRHTLGEILAMANVYVYDGSDKLQADATNTLVVYFDNDKNVYADSYLYTLFPDEDLSGYTVVCYSGLNLSAFDFGWESNGWFSDSWYDGFVYYVPSCGANYWSTVHGWQYGYATNTDAAFYVWDYGTASWWYTSEALYPWVFRYTYDADSTAWGGSWYEYESGSAPDRVFHVWTNATDVDEGDLPNPGY